MENFGVPSAQSAGKEGALPPMRMRPTGPKESWRLLCFSVALPVGADWREPIRGEGKVEPLTIGSFTAANQTSQASQLNQSVPHRPEKEAAF